jgi:nucleoside phosphorylase
MLVLAAVTEELGALDGETVGIGPVVAAAQAGALLARLRPDRVLMIGTCGVYSGTALSIGMAVMARRIGLSYGVAAMGLGYVPRAPEPIDCAADLLKATSLPQADVLTTGAITTDPVLAERLADHWEVEHLESFGVALACQRANIPFNAILGITNDVGPTAHAQWLAHREEAQEAARQAVRLLLG